MKFWGGIWKEKTLKTNVLKEQTSNNLIFYYLFLFFIVYYYFLFSKLILLVCLERCFPPCVGLQWSVLDLVEMKLKPTRTSLIIQPRILDFGYFVLN